MTNNDICLESATSWIIHAMKGPNTSTEDYVQKLLEKMLRAIESYFHPSNDIENPASEGLHLFVSYLCKFFTQRVHLERQNTKWPCETPEECRLSDKDIGVFVNALTPITFYILYNDHTKERQNIFNCLATLKPDVIIPKLIKHLHTDVHLMNTPNRLVSFILQYYWIEFCYGDVRMIARAQISTRGSLVKCIVGALLGLCIRHAL